MSPNLIGATLARTGQFMLVQRPLVTFHSMTYWNVGSLAGLIDEFVKLNRQQFRRD